MKWVDKLIHLDRRYIYLIVLLSVVLPLMNPMGLPIKVTPSVEASFKAYEDLPKGALVLMSIDYGPSTAVELEPMALAACDQVMNHGQKVAFMALYPEGQALTNRLISRIKELHKDKEEGVDYVNLGYKAGNEAVPLKMGLDFRSQFPTDTRGKPLSEIPMLRDVTQLKQFALVATYSAGFPGALEHIRITASEYGMPLVVGTTAVQTPQYFPYFDSGQVVGIIGGLRGAAEYEKLAGFKGTATGGMEAQSIAHFTVAGLIILANILTLLQFLNKKGRG
ncbi:MAG TPA: hypothetical protein EYO33_03805 [Phycisphaerales bacterium]|nr:hypothetical protein [Phycisphaerales bacterium]